MGGLDCRYLTSHLPRKFDVLSVTTIATPHRGSSFADHFLSTLGKARMPGFLSLLDLLPNGGGDGKAFDSLTLDSMRKFNEEVRNVEGVKYFSWGAVYEPGFVDTWKWPHGVILEKEGPNDGLVSVESAKWVSVQCSHLCYILIFAHPYLTGNLPRHNPKREPPRPGGVDESCAVQVGGDDGQGD